MIDSHCHLTAPEFASDVTEVIERARKEGIRNMVCISDAMEDIEPCRLLAEKHEDIFFTAGTHPHHAKDFDAARDLPRIRAAASHDKCVGIGEIGLDYHYMSPPSPAPAGLRWTGSPKDLQQRGFEAQLTLAKELDIPSVIHCREAVEDVWTIVSHVKPRMLVVHCCTERWIDVKRFVEAGYYLSFTGIITYPKSQDIRETAKQCPLSQLMIETDAPFLAPVPHRGKRCEPMHVLEVLKAIAEIKGISLEEVDRITTENAIKFFCLRP